MLYCDDKESSYLNDPNKSRVHHKEESIDGIVFSMMVGGSLCDIGNSAV